MKKLNEMLGYSLVAVALVIGLGVFGLLGCASMMGGKNATLYDSSTTTTTETFGEGQDGERVLVSRVTEHSTEHIDGITQSGPFSKITGDVGTTVTYDGVSGDYTVSTAGKADVEGGLDEVMTYMFQAAAQVGSIQASETAAVMAEVRALLVQLQEANASAEE